MKSLRMLCLCILLGLVPTASGYGLGAPLERCENMLPGHGPQPQTSEPPFEIIFPQGKTTYAANEQIQVTLRSIGDKQFKGFLIQPRPSVDSYSTFGTITSLPTDARNLQCSGKVVAITHTSSVLKTSITFTWTAPSSDAGDIIFVYTVVESKAVYWVKRSSAKLSYSTEVQTQEPVSTNTDNTTPTQTTPTPTTTQFTGTVSKINRDPACGVSKTCFPSDCSQDCEYLVTWEVSGTDDVIFSVQRKTSENNYYIALGLSADPKMGNDSVMGCVSKDGQVVVMASYNNPATKMNTQFENQNFGLIYISGSYKDGILSCTFSRKKNAVLAQNALGRRRREVTDESMFFDLSEEWYLLVAHGQSNQGVIWKHTEFPKISPMKIDFLTLGEDKPTTPAMGDSGVINKLSGCGDSVGCFHDCDGSGSCGFLLTWAKQGDDIALTLTCKQSSSNAYCAIGMSKDKKMGDDSVFECVSNGGTQAVYVSYNSGRSNERLDQETFGISSVSTSHIDGILKCTFMRKKTATFVTQGGRRKRQTQASASTYFDMTQDWTLLYAYGNAIGGFVSKHSTLPTISSQSANFERFMDISASGVDKSQVKLHGILMTAAWMFFATFGIFMARFYKTVWPQGMEWCDQKRWFVIHRAFMVTAFLLTAASFVVIFVHVKGYAEIEGSNFEKSHPIIGIVVMGLALTNPIMAAFRPHPGEPKRNLFNFAHTLVGVSASVCGIVNIFSGTILVESFVPTYVRIILWVAVGWACLIEIVSYVYDHKAQKAQRGEAYEMKSTSDPDASMTNQQRVPQFKVVVLWLHGLAMLGLTVGVCVVIGLGDRLLNDDHGH